MNEDQINDDALKCPGAYNRGDCGVYIGDDPHDIGLCADCRLEVEVDIRRTEAEVDTEAECGE